VRLTDRLRHRPAAVLPQKKKPGCAGAVRGKTGRVFGHFQGLLHDDQGPAPGLQTKVQEDKEALFEWSAPPKICLEAMRF